jgi:hypothetical protein
MKCFIGDCVTGLDDPDFCNAVAEDATELAQLVEKGKRVSRRKFCSDCAMEDWLRRKIAGHAISYWQSDSVWWLYDETDDVHFFFG